MHSDIPMSALAKEADSNDPAGCKLYALPLVLPAERPFAQELPMFLLRLATEVDYLADES